MKLKLDDSLHPINDSYARLPLKATATVVIAVSSIGTATIAVPAGERWFIKAITITKEADTTVTLIAIDGNDANTIATVADTVATYGSVITADSTIAITGTNADAVNAESLTIAVTGYKIV